MMELPFGTWPSPVTPELLTEGAVGLVDVWVDNGITCWLESRPSEAGRLQIVRLQADGSHADVLPEGFSARSAVHEYGGGAAWVESGIVWFVNWSDQRLYRMPVDSSSAPVALTPEPAVTRSLRYADLRISPDGRWLVCVRERHGEDHQVENEIVVLDAHVPGDPVVVSGGADFVMAPRFAASDRLRWIAWDHPNMPWNDTALMECRFDPSNGACAEAETLTTGCSLMQPLDDLVISDRSGWWNVWAVHDDEEYPVVAVDAEIGGPAWNFGSRDYVLLGPGRVLCTFGEYVFCDNDVVAFDAVGLDHLVWDGSRVTALARYADRTASIIRFSPEALDDYETIVAGRPVALADGDVSVPEQIEFPTVDGERAYAWLYPPANSVYDGPGDAAPPLVVMIHGGPTSDAVPTFSLAKQFWTSRGFAVVDVNHRGSTGFGTEFRNLLDGQWGVVDVQDCCAAARWLAGQGRVDPQRMVIRGGSAGGFTVLASMAFADVFAAGASLYGIADLSVLASDTHKFESRYLDRLVGPWPEARNVYEARSPIHHTAALDRPLIVFQGLDDMVVPPNQSEMIVAALQANGVECEYHAYEGEGHGFRKAETIVHQISQELAFYQRVLGLG